MYEPFYKLHSKPFRLTPDPHFFFTSSVHNRALAYLRHGLDNGEGFCVLIGAPGTGKTTLMHTLVTELPTDEVIIAELVTTHLNPDETLQLVAAVLGVPYRDIAKATLLKRIRDFLIEKTQEGKRVLLLVDEAHNLPQRSLEVLRILTNFQLKEKALLQCILLGQESLRTKLAQPRMVHLQQRVTAMCRLRPLAASESKAYIEHRLSQAGWKGDPHLSKAAHTLIFQHAGGIPRCINKLCERLLLYGAIEELHDIDANNVAAVINELAQENNIQTHSSAQESTITSPESSQIIRLVAKKARSKATANSDIMSPSALTPTKKDVQQPTKISHDIQNKKIKIITASTQPSTPKLKKKVQTEAPTETKEIENKRKKRAPLLFFNHLATHQVSWLILASITVFSITIYTFSTPTMNDTTQTDQPQWAATTPTPSAESLAATPVANISDPIQRSAISNPTYPEFWEPEYKIDSTVGIAKAQEKVAEVETSTTEISEAIEVKEGVILASAPVEEFSPIEQPQAKKPQKQTTAPPKKVVVIAQPAPAPKPKPKPKPKIQVPAPVNEQINVTLTEPAPTTPQVEKTPPNNDIAKPELAALLAQFSSAYEQGDVSELMRLFDEQARTNDNDNAKSIANDYRKLFDVTDDRSMGFSQLNWEQEGSKARGSGEFKVTIRQKGRRRSDEYTGNITLQIEKNAPGILITELYYEYD